MLTEIVTGREAENQHLAMSMFDKTINAVMEGKVDPTSDISLTSMVKSGKFINAVPLLPEYEVQLKQLWTASMIATIWSAEGTYIVASDVSGSGGCKADRRGLQVLKACLSEYPDKVFYTFFKTAARENQPNAA
jgi:hypothetical protein